MARRKNYIRRDELLEIVKNLKKENYDLQEELRKQRKSNEGLITGTIASWLLTVGSVVAISLIKMGILTNF